MTISPFSARDEALLRHVLAVGGPTSPNALEQVLHVSRTTINRAVRDLVAAGFLDKQGDGRSTRYVASEAAQIALAASIPYGSIPTEASLFQWSRASLPLVESLRAPLGTRTPVGYDRTFVSDYIPNQSSLLPLQLATELYSAGRSLDQHPAGTYAREVLEQLLIDLSWSSSRLEGNNKSLLDTKELFELGEGTGPMDEDTLMLLNHKNAIEFMVEAVPTEGITLPVLVDLQAKLMQDLLKDARDIGSIRRRIVNIDGSVYSPSNIPTLLEVTLKDIIEKAHQIRNPVEAAFFLWVNVAYLQPFADGNKRTSRLSANMPLLLYNCAPLSFLDVERTDYATAMMGVYEQRNVTAAVELFEFIYRRSIQKYSVLRASLSVPDPLRARYRKTLNELMQFVVFYGKTLNDAVSEVPVDAADLTALRAIANTELDQLEQYNCARYNLARGMTQRWIDAGRPR
ncbi:Fic family protein [Actimicrobium sp. CCI2.3]|uniref:Fic family protein n=1 Tax=Actimicrobium sp. CCI2.3 TaxID=3048616 RepID=UPI002AB56B4E|nr:Fic family protein [Actimicrobium sp. CCI2.3]MDY7574570.1 Fic family protein [Actimicrobium sp. CCI2.3]MEB0020946.1 Fic family protein [Actimicrobium sp. CCI2.3]